ncbi:MAG: Kelch repeat-containing protein [Planctomycetota bacterium]|jgi:hypothetical protein
MTTKQLTVLILLAAGPALLLGFGCKKEKKEDVDGLVYNPPPPPTGPAGTFLQVGDLLTGRTHHAASRLANGNVIVLGGEDATSTVLSSAELYDYHYGSFVPVTSTMLEARSRFQFIRFVGEDKYLLCGGTDGTATLATAEILDTADFSFTATAVPMISPRLNHGAVQLLNGNVFICGGRDAAGVPLVTCEIYDRANDTFLPCANSLSVARADHSVTRLSNGKVLIAGGVDSTGAPIASAEIFDPAGGLGDQGTFAATNALPSGRAGHVARLISVAPPPPATSFAGQVVLTGGYQGSASVPVPIASAVAFDPVAAGGVGVFSSLTNTMVTARLGHTVTTLTGGLKSLVVGGNITNQPELFDPYAGSTGTLPIDADFTRTVDAGSVNTAMTAVTSGRAYHTATWLLNGTILLCGGFDGGTVTATAEIYNP